MRRPRRLLTIGLLCLCAGIFLHAARSLAAALQASTVPNPLPVIIIDAGHGGQDGGAVANNVVEKDINLQIARDLRDMLLVNGFEVVMTRDADISIHEEGIAGVGKQKTSDLHNRLAIMQRYSNAVFISIHQNKFWQSSSQGGQVFYSPNHSDSQSLAEKIQTTLVADLQPDNHRKIKQAGDNLFLMKEASCPAVLVECGFLSNTREAARLATRDYQRQLAFCIMSALLQYLELDRPNGIQANAFM
jgi:N-acetylmuramoyl-L-alanine amidase